jgi:CHASE3 domain sensor protein
VTQTYNVLNILEETQAHIADAETGQRGYLLTSRLDYYSLYDTAMAAINNNIQKVSDLRRSRRLDEGGTAQSRMALRAKISIVRSQT